MIPYTLSLDNKVFLCCLFFLGHIIFAWLLLCPRSTKSAFGEVNQQLRLLSANWTGTDNLKDLAQSGLLVITAANPQRLFLV